MKSTGEAIRFIKTLKDPYFRQLYKEKEYAVEFLGINTKDYSQLHFITTVFNIK